MKRGVYLKKTLFHDVFIKLINNTDNLIEKFKFKIEIVFFKKEMILKATNLMEEKYGYKIQDLEVKIFSVGLALLQWTDPFEEQFGADYIPIKELI
jgi:hypothetical protein